MTTTLHPQQGLDEQTSPPMSTLFPQIAQALKGSRIAWVICQYDGQRNFQQVYDPAFYTGRYKVCRRKLSADQCQQLRAYFVALLQQRCPGWEQGEGSRGEFVWRMRTDELIHQHDVRVVNFTTTQTAGTGPDRARPPVQVERMLVVAASHLSSEEVSTLTAYDYQHGEGAWLMVAGNSAEFAVPTFESKSPGLSLVLDFAYKHQCAYVLFDRDAEPLMGAPTNEDADSK